MQRKNYILKRRGMAMLMAIFLLVILGTIMGLTISMTSTTTARTANNYLHEQALLLTSSATEYALLALSGHNTAANGCINSINAQYPQAGAAAMFDINITMNYVGYGAIVGCNNYIPNINSSLVAGEDTNGTVMMDVVVTSNAGLGLTEPIRYHRRTLQKM